MMRISLVCLLVCVFGAPVAHADFYYNFEDDTVGTIPGYFSTVIGQVSDSYGLPGQSYNVNIAQFQSGDLSLATAIGGMGHQADGFASGSVEFDVYVASAYSYFQFLLNDENVDGQYKVNIQFSNGYIQDGYTLKDFGQVLSVGQWHHIRVDFDCDAGTDGTYTLTFNGVGLGTEDMNSSATGAQVNTLVLDHLNDNGYDIYYDNIIAERPLNTYAYDFDDEAPGATFFHEYHEYWDSSGSVQVSATDTLEMTADNTAPEEIFTGTLTTNGAVYEDYSHGILTFDYYVPTGLADDDTNRTDVLFKSAGAIYIGLVKIFPGSDKIQVYGDSGVVETTSAGLVVGWNQIQVDYDFSLNTIGGSVNGDEFDVGSTWNTGDASYKSAVRTLLIANYGDHTVYLDNIYLEQTPRCSFDRDYDLKLSGRIDLADYAEFAAEYMDSEDDIVVSGPWDGAGNADYVVSVEGKNSSSGDQFCRLGSYEFDGNGNVSVNYWNWTFSEYASDPDQAWVVTNSVIGTFAEDPNYTADATKNVVTLRKFYEGTSDQLSRSATYVQNQRFIDITYSDNGDTERWYLSWQQDDNLYKLELVDASYIDALPKGDTGFESYSVGSAPPSPWEGYGTDGNVVAIQANSGSRSVELANGDNLGQTLSSGMTSATFDYSFMFEGVVGNGDVILYVTDGASDIYAKILFSTASGVLNSSDGGYGSNMISGGVSEGIWHDVSLIVDHSALTMDIYYDGVLVGDDIAFYDSDGSGYTNNATARGYLNNDNNLKVYVDDFRAFSGGDYFVQAASSDEAIRNEKGIVASGDPEIHDANIGILAAGFAFGSSTDIAVPPALADIKKNFTGVQVDYGTHGVEGLDGLDNPFIFNCDNVGYWNDANDVIRYINEDADPNVFLYFTRPTAGNSGVVARRLMYQNSHDFEGNGHIEDNPGHMIPGLAIIDGNGDFRGMVGVQFFAQSPSQWTAANFWFELPATNDEDDELRNGVAGNIYKENFDSYCDGCFLTGMEWILGASLYTYVTAADAYSGNSLKIDAAAPANDYAKLILPQDMPNGRLKFKYYVNPLAGGDNGLDLFARDSSDTIGSRYQFVSDRIYLKSAAGDETVLWTLPHGNWYSVELVFDAVKDLTILYVDDVYIGQMGGMYTKGAGAAASITFAYVDGTVAEEKLIDDISILEFYPNNCFEKSLFGYGLDADFSWDCDVDLEDLMMFVGHWLEE